MDRQKKIETAARIEPCFFQDTIPSILADLTVELHREADNLGRGLHPESVAELADLVRMMNCYCSNLFEGHNTKDIEKALSGAEVEPERGALALKAKAHVIVQRKIDAMHSKGDLPSPTSVEFIAWEHRMLYHEMLEEFRFIERPDGSKVEIVPGEFRKTANDDGVVSRHQPPSSDRVGAFMAYCSKRFGLGPIHIQDSQN
ncbi:hypothetical protein D3227_37470 [Mesorhizobium waimense]|uniref:Uncharacterized protein n=1 Tax=Mesorhizobium waimense TaxID=1300307 RepID=A0A3A5K1T2_9HYPH|nr:hypothetical protein [Mesorhizobium waimense]RJT26208.1 hypothetical protein D3227_37470 [Mesorhizobium waimense]